MYFHYVKVCYMYELFSIQVVFEALRGVNYAGDIAIDDITLANGLCAGIGRFRFHCLSVLLGFM